MSINKISMALKYNIYFPTIITAYIVGKAKGNTMHT